MTQYWISPSGQLFMIVDYSHTADFVEEDPNPKFSFIKFRWVPNGTHGDIPSVSNQIYYDLS